MNLAPLQSYLNPELAAHLARTGDLPVAERMRLSAALHAELAACAAFIPARLVRAQLADPHPGRTSGAFWEGSLLFADLSGFTALSEQLSVLGRQGAEEVSAVVNRLFSALVAEIQLHHGTLLKFGGDALTAFFDADALGHAHAAAAATAAIAMQERMQEFVGVQTRAGAFTLQLRVGVHSGRVFAAEVGDASHIELVVTGPEVNRVAYAQEIAVPGETVITTATAAYFPDAQTEPAGDGFVRITTLPPLTMPPAPPNPLPAAGSGDLADLARLAAQLEALRPYLVRGLPQRFLASADTGLGEFRPVTVLFANVADFGPLITRLHNDAARAAALFNAYFRRAQAVVHRYDGIVNKVDMATHGDKLMALFGAPTAHEDDPTRAVHCALELRRVVEEANAEIRELLSSPDKGTGRQRDGDQQAVPLSLLPSVPLSQKIGLNTGTVFAGRVGGATRYEYTVMGSAVNLAARLMAAAPEGAIYLSPSTRTAVAGHVQLRDGPPLTLKGITTPVVPALALGLGGGSSPGVAPTRLSAAPLIGRDNEMSRLLTAAAAALRGQGRVLALIGEAGTGKTRLHEELMRRLVLASAAVEPTALHVPPFDIFLSDCQSYEQRTPYAAIRPLLRELLGLTGTLLNESDLATQLQVRVDQFAPQRARFMPLLGDILGLQLDETGLTAALSPQQRHDRLQELVIDLLRGISRRAPLIITVEDLHWADASSLDLLARVAAAAASMPLLLLLTYRPEPPIPAPWIDLPDTTALRLGELSAADSLRLIDALLGGGVPNGLQALVERTQGNPFFIEELVRALVAGQILVQEAEGRWRLSRPLAEVALPTSIEGLLTARLDRLDEPRQELVQVASVIGRRFQRPVVEGVYANPAPIDESLNQLIAIELILADQFDRVLAYLFRHALLRDVAYERILYARRRVLHARVAHQIESIGAEQIEEQLAPLAWHYLQAEAWEPALEYHLRAAEQSRRRFANRDALELYRTALQIAPRLVASSTPAVLIERVAGIHEAIGDIHLLLGEYDLAEAQFREALELAAAGAAPVISERWLRLHRLLATLEERRSNYDAAFQWLHVGMARATAALRAEMARCHLLGAGIYFRQGVYTQAMEWGQMGLRLAEQVQSSADQAHALLLLGNLWRDQGDLGQAIAAFERARLISESTNDITRLGDALNNLGILYTRAGRWPETIASFERSLEISEMIGDVQATARTANNLAVVLVGRNQLDRAAELYQLSSTMFGQIGSALGVAVTTYNRGEVLLYQDRPADALAVFAQAISDLERINARTFLPDVLRLHAEAGLALHAYAAAEASAARSLAIAVELGMGAEAAVARRALGQLALANGDPATAKHLLDQSRAELSQLDNRYELGRTLYQLARLAAAQSDTAAQELHAAAAAAIFRELDAERDLALIATLSTVD